MSLNLTDCFKELPPDQLALMSAICRELSWLESRAQMPMLAGEPRQLRAWLLAGVEDFGMLANANAKALRRHARQVRWNRLTRDSSVEWTNGGLSSAMSLARHALFFCHVGAAPSTGDYEPIGLVDAIFIQMICAMLALLVWVGIDSVLANAGLAMGVYGVGWGWLASMALTRVVLWMKYADGQRGRFQARAAVPAVVRGWRALSSWMAEKRSRVGARRQGFEEIQSALRRASLGQGPSSEESRDEAVKAELALLRKESVKEASQPGRQLALDEREELASVGAKSRSESAKAGRL